MAMVKIDRSVAKFDIETSRVRLMIFIFSTSGVTLTFYLIYRAFCLENVKNFTVVSHKCVLMSP